MREPINHLKIFKIIWNSSNYSHSNPKILNDIANDKLKERCSIQKEGCFY